MFWLKFINVFKVYKCCVCVATGGKTPPVTDLSAAVQEGVHTNSICISPVKVRRFFTSLRQSVSSWQRRHLLNFLREYRFWFTPTLLSRWGVYTHSFSVGFDLAKTTFAQFTEGFIKKFLLAWPGLRIQIFFGPDPDPTRDILQIMLNTVFYKLTLGHEKINQIN